jgi:hypothetical protein
LRGTICGIARPTKKVPPIILFGHALLAHGGTGGDNGRKRCINSAVSI